MIAKVNDKTALLELLIANSDQIYSFGVKKLGLFGSFVRDQNIRKGSDIDFVVVFEAGKKSSDNFMDLAFFLEDLTGRKVELLTRAAMGKFIRPYILKELENVGLQRRRRIAISHSRRP